MYRKEEWEIYYGTVKTDKSLELALIKKGPRPTQFVCLSYLPETHNMHLMAGKCPIFTDHIQDHSKYYDLIAAISPDTIESLDGHQYFDRFGVRLKLDWIDDNNEFFLKYNCFVYSGSKRVGSLSIKMNFKDVMTCLLDNGYTQRSDIFYLNNHVLLQQCAYVSISGSYPKKHSITR